MLSRCFHPLAHTLPTPRRRLASGLRYRSYIHLRMEHPVCLLLSHLPCHLLMSSTYCPAPFYCCLRIHPYSSKSYKDFRPRNDASLRCCPRRLHCLRTHRTGRSTSLLKCRPYSYTPPTARISPWDTHSLLKRMLSSLPHIGSLQHCPLSESEPRPYHH